MKLPRLDPRTVLWTLGALAAAGAVVAAAIVFLGLYNVSAQKGHLPGVSWVLHTTFRNSVEFHARPRSEVPELTDAMAALGARHYDAACAHCHAAPGRKATATMLSMLPEPPHVTEAVKDWGPAELHWIVHEGVKMSGMPAWPVARPDDVWPVVAFLTRVQEGMDGTAYARLVDLPAGEPTGFAYCASCHGRRGATSNPHIPQLDIQSPAYLRQALDAYLTGERSSGIMVHAASEVPPEDLPDLARRFTGFVPEATATDPDPRAEAGRALAYAGTGTRVPACRACHGPWPEQIDERFPSLAGQNEAYLIQQLELWRAGTRGTGPVANLMRQAAERLSDTEISALAAYYATLRPAPVNDTAETD